MANWLVGLLLVLAVAHAETPSIEKTQDDDILVEVSRDSNNTYHFNMQFVANAPAHRVHAIITDYDRLTELNPLIKQSRVLPQNESDNTRVELVTEGCMLFFCKKIIRVEEVQVKDQLTIKTHFIVELSDFKSGETLWTFTPQGQHTLVNYRASMQPDFWLPPFVGPYMLKQQLHKQLHYTANKINVLLLTHGD